MKIAIALLGAMSTLACGCAASTGVVDAGGGNYYASKQAATGFSGIGSLKGDVISEAGDYCTQHGKSLQIVKTTEANPPFILGNYPRVEIEFTCEKTGNRG